MWLLRNDHKYKTSAKYSMVPWASYQIRKIAGCACAGNAGKVFPRRRIQRKLLVSDPGMHHGTCVTHVPWCMSGSLTRSGGENVPGIPGACAPAILFIWQEAHYNMTNFLQNNMTNFLQITHNRHPIACPWGRGIGRALWVVSRIYVQPLFVLYIIIYYNWPCYCETKLGGVSKTLTSS